MIGIGITTRNRYHILRNVLNHWLDNTTEDFIIHVCVDDQDPVNQEAYVGAIGNDAEFELQHTRIGIAKAKNVNLRYLRSLGCDKIFLADDDIFPVRKGYEKMFDGSYIMQQYVDSRLEGAIGRFNTCINMLKKKNGFILYDDSPGCLQYITKDVTEEFNDEFGIYGFEHIEWNRRVAKNHNLHPFVSPDGIDDYFYSPDLHGNLMGIWGYGFTKDNFTSSVHGEDVESYVKENSKVYVNQARWMK